MDRPLLKQALLKFFLGVVALSGLLFVAAFIVAGLNLRYGWCVLPFIW